MGVYLKQTGPRRVRPCREGSVLFDQPFRHPDRPHPDDRRILLGDHRLQRLLFRHFLRRRRECEFHPFILSDFAVPFREGRLLFAPETPPCRKPVAIFLHGREAFPVRVAGIIQVDPGIVRTIGVLRVRPFVQVPRIVPVLEDPDELPVVHREVELHAQ